MLLCLFIGTITCLHAQLFSEYNFKFKNYTVKDGLPHDKVNKVVQDSRGFLWLATEGGLARFDGYSFKNFRHEAGDTTSLPFDNLVDIAIDGLDRIWLAYSHGFCYFDPASGMFSRVVTKSKSLTCQKLIYDAGHHRIYIASRNDGLYYFDERTGELKTTTLSNPMPHNITSIMIDSKGLLRMTIERNGFFKYDPVKNKAQYIEGNDWLMFITEDVKRKQFYAGRWLGEFMPFDGSELPPMDKRYVIKQFDGYEKCTYTDCDFAPKITGEDIIWVSSHFGLALFDVSKKRFVKHIYYNPTMLDGISSNWLNDIFISGDGSIWIASWNGLHNVNPQAQSFSKHYIPELDINLYNLISGIADDPTNRNKVWMTANGTGLIEWDKQAAKITKYHFKSFLYPRDDNYEKRWLHHIHKDKKGILWMGSYGGFAKVENGRVSHIDTWVDGKPVYGSDSYQDDAGMLWLAGRHLIMFDPNNEHYQAISFPDGVKHDVQKDNFTSLADWDKEKIWVGSTLGLYILNKASKALKQLTLTYPKLDHKVLNNIRSLYRVGDKLYIGTYVGLFCLHLTTGKLEKLLESFVEQKSMMADEQGFLWVFTPKGFYKINTQTHTWQRYDQNDGIYTLSTDPITLFYYQDQMHIGHRSLFTSFDPGKLGQNNNVPLTYITEVNALGKEYTISSSGKLILPYNESDVSFTFTALEYAAPGKLTFSCLLEGFDKTWSDYTETRVKNYTHLPHGKYTFKVKARNINGVESTQVAEYAITVKPAIWQTWWFQSLALALLLTGLYSWYNIRIRGIRKRAEEKIALDKKMAALDEKLLRSQMNPHFIFNSLNSIQKYIWESKEELAAEYLASFAKLMRAILENSRKEYVSLEEEFKILKLYIDLEHRRSNGKFEYQLLLDPALDSTRIKILPLILQPFIENAIWHGLGKKEEGGMLRVSIQKEDEHNMKVVIEDNGVGRKKEVMPDRDAPSLGQSITRQRLEKLMEVTRKNAEVQIIDLVDEQGTAAGTRVELQLPIIY